METRDWWFVDEISLSRGSTILSKKGRIGMIEDIRSAADMDRLVAEREGYVLLWLWAAWCRPCQVMAPAVQALEERFAGKIRVVRMEVDEQEELAEGFGLVGVPTFILYKDGEEKGRIIGYRMKAKFFEEIEGLMK